MQSTGPSRVFSNTTVQKHQFFSAQLCLWSNLCIHWKNHSFDIWTCVGKVVSLLFNMLSRLVIAFLPRSKRLLISWLQSPSAVILEPRMKFLTVSTTSLPTRSSPVAVWGFSRCGAGALGCTGSVAWVHGLSCPVACGIFHDQGLEPLSFALQGRFLTTGPPGKPTLYLQY